MAPAGRRRARARPRRCARPCTSMASRRAEHGLPRRHGGRLVVEPVARLAQTHQRGGRDRRIVEADRPAGSARPRRRKSPTASSVVGPVEERRFGRRRGSERTTGRGSGGAGVGARAGRRPSRRTIGIALRLRQRMCGRFTQQRPASELAEIFGAEPLADDPGGHYNVAPDGRGTRRRPARGPPRGHRLPLGADPALGDAGQGRLEHVQRPGRDADREPGLPRRLPAQALPGARSIRSTSGSARARSASRTGSSGAMAAPLVLAGLWAGWRDPATERVRRTFTIVTTAPNAAMADLHDRMPVDPPRRAWDRWLDPALARSRRAARPARAADEIARDLPGRALVNDVRSDGPELIEPLAAVSGALGLIGARRGRATPRFLVPLLAGVQPSAAAAERRPSPGSSPSSSAAAKAPTMFTNAPSGSSSGASNTMASPGDALRHLHRRRPRRRSAGVNPARRSATTAIVGIGSVAQRPRPRSRSGSAAPGRHRRRRARSRCTAHRRRRIDSRVVIHDPEAEVGRGLAKHGDVPDAER